MGLVCDVIPCYFQGASPATAFVAVALHETRRELSLGHVTPQEWETGVDRRGREPRAVTGPCADDGRDRCGRQKREQRPVPWVPVGRLPHGKKGLQ